ncbi:STAS-like domain-containing protein [Cronobacter sakazakii]|uniref:STAS-like domain-containing protein n=1 Tax=Cronobacter sakazakii TaxID=28141 RepID=UPI000DA158BD|nr:STAS-like domain-containing protein [Cronobacter sakazakii]ELY2860861.1 STAS-like domain-containing protein [Cronobacter sakazakii]ELY4115121.1 STAS-like domain-containing protein [Cronobacter sakazakii]ELY4200164.1 STAS-like domain-containing protein [Cronobacter sakazakii]KAB0838052.1 DUF4325 domain-containing protein [Cronobacter sakazakii]MCI0302330.1 DUF4325 domain-containing protein [Cronobacter sakazakii]
MKIIKVASRYPCPGPRFKKLGPASGEDFREWVEKELKHSSELTIDLDGTEGYGSSFLEECFGGLVRRGIDPAIIKNIKFKSEEEPELIDEITEYIDDAIRILYGHS